MTTGEFALHGTVWLSLTAWATASVLPAACRQTPEHDASLTPTASTLPAACRHRLLWTLGAFALAGHFALAMQLRHHWSHAAAVADTAQQTQAKFGLNWGGGVWFNYAMVLLWLMDAAWSFLDPSRWNAAGNWPRILRGYLFFMWFNGAVVFPRGPVRWFGLFACMIVLWSWWRGSSFRESASQSGG
jgi:hypothetical protein